MQSPHQLIESGLLESYVLGLATADEMSLVFDMTGRYPEIAAELSAIESALENHALMNAVDPHPATRAMLMAGIDYAARAKAGTLLPEPPLLSSTTKAEDFAEWLSHPDMAAPVRIELPYAKIIAYSPQRMLAVVWASDLLITESHSNELESFFVLEGRCEITLGEETHILYPGNFLAIPLHTAHTVKIDPSMPCKVILQRKAA